MQVVASNNAASLREATTLSRKWYFWPVRILGNVRALLYLVVGLFVGGRLIVDGFGETPVNVIEIGKGFLVLALFAGLLGFLYYRQTSKLAKISAAQAPIKVNFESNGITVLATDGTSVFEPWSLYKDFRVGQHMVALGRKDKKGFRVIPTDTLSPHENGQLRSILLSNLPESS